MLVRLGFGGSAPTRSEYRRQSYRAAKRFGESYGLGQPILVAPDTYGYALDYATASLLAGRIRPYGGYILREARPIQRYDVGDGVQIRSLAYDRVRGYGPGDAVWVIQAQRAGSFLVWNHEEGQWYAGVEVPSAAMLYRSLDAARKDVGRAKQALRLAFPSPQHQEETTTASTPQELQERRTGLRGTVMGGHQSPHYRNRPRRSSPERRRYGKRRKRRRGFPDDSTFGVP